MKFPIIPFIIIFLVGWILGVICIITLIMEIDEPGNVENLRGARGVQSSHIDNAHDAKTDEFRTSSSKKSILKENIPSTTMAPSKMKVTSHKKRSGLLGRAFGSILDAFEDKDGTKNDQKTPSKDTIEATQVISPVPTLPMAHKLPHFLLNDTFRDDEAEQSFIFLDFPADDRLFTLDNYRALESLLHVSPSAVIRCLIPTPLDAYHIKIGNQLSVNHFSKYKRRGYDIKVMPVGLMNKGYTAQMGKRYWAKWSEECCTKCNIKCRSSDRVQPYHVHNYIRLSKLWKKGGVFSDFSFFFLGPLDLPVIRQGFYINTRCASSSGSGSSSNSNINNNNAQSGSNSDSHSVGVNDNNNNNNNNMGKTLLVANDSNVTQSIGSASTSASVTVTATAAATAMATESMWHNSHEDTTASSKCLASTLLVFNTPKSPIILCVLGKYDDEDFINCVEGDRTSLGGASCVAQAFVECFAKEGVKNDLDDGAWDSVIETFGDDPDKASQAVRSSDWLLSPHKRVIWLGSVAWSEYWSSSPSLVNGSLIAVATAAISLKPLPMYEKIHTCALNHSHYSTDIFANISSLSFSSSSSSSSLSLSSFATSSSLTTSIPPTYGTGLESLAVSPSIFLVGFIKSASTFMFQAITSHPQVLPPLRGSQLKESRCYLPVPPRRLLKRMWCYPFVEPGEPFAIADGTVTYATDPIVPRLLYSDTAGRSSSGAKIVFVVRHPVDRIYSQYKAAIETLATKGSFDEFLEGGMKEYDKFGNLRNMVVNGTSQDVVIDYYYNSSFRGSSSLATLMMHSIPYPAIAHYMNILGKQNVIVVKSDDLDTNNWPQVQATMHGVFSSLGLCPHKLSRLALPPTLTSDTTVPPDKQMSQEMYLRLSKFFEPFNQALASLSGLNLTSWYLRQPSSDLPLHTPGMNTSMELAWFQLQERPKQANGIMSHLLPKGKQEDIGSNTTLGLITMF